MRRSILLESSSTRNHVDHVDHVDHVNYLPDININIVCKVVSTPDAKSAESQSILTPFVTRFGGKGIRFISRNRA
ncbi:MAG: hypothetical protein Q6370_007490, partial [Candidatus Sigynarchaeota archaeon]